MTRQALSLIAVIIVTVTMTILAVADIPRLISFQGKLYDSEENPLTGEYEVTFRIYDVDEGGTVLWYEIKSVMCENGLYSVILGQIISINLDFDGQYWLGIQVTGDDELSPRYRLVSVPTAFRAQVANQVSWTNLTDVPAGFADGSDDVGAAGGVSQINPGTCLEVTNPTGPTTTVAHAADASALPNAHHTKTTDASELTAGTVDNALFSAYSDLSAEGKIGIGSDKVAPGNHNHDGDYSPIDHDHDDEYVNETGPEEMTGNSTDPVLEATNNGNGEGIYGQSSGGYGIYGKNSVSGNFGWLGFSSGVYGEHVGQGNYGLLGGSSEGVSGYSESGRGVYGQSESGRGVYGLSTLGYGVYGFSGHGFGVYGSCSDGWAGYFDGDAYISGRAGIGTTDPGAKLTVSSNNAYTDPSGFQVLGTGQRLYISANGSIGDPSKTYSAIQSEGWFLAWGPRYLLLNPSGGNVGIGTTSPGSLLELKASGGSSAGGLRVVSSTNTNTVIHIQDANPGDRGMISVRAGDSDKIVLRADGDTYFNGGDVGIGTSSPNYKLDVRGTIGSNTTLYHSDVRWKKNIRDLPDALNTLMKLRGVSYEWRTDEFVDMNFSEGQKIGVIAQEVEKVLPEIVSEDDQGYKSVAYSKLTPILIEAVKELKEENDKLKKRIDALEKAIE